MCCLFGLLDYKQKLSSKQRNHIIRKLSVACEKRGTDATGIAYNRNGCMEIYKAPLPAHSFRHKIPEGVTAVMGHTRLTTQGNEKFNFNNHPFRGECEDMNFALAHNGVLYNDVSLRRELKLPKTKIETDSYIAVQMIEDKGTFSLDAIKDMAERVEGSFCFTLLDEDNTLYLVKGNNPMTVYHFDRLGFYVYASTEEILKKGLQKAGYGYYSYKAIDIDEGDIVIIKANGELKRYNFDTKNLTRGWRYGSIFSGYGSYDYCGYGYYSSPFDLTDKRSDVRKNTKSNISCGEYLDMLIDYGAMVGVSDDEIIYLFENGFAEEDIEELLATPHILHNYVDELIEMEFV